MRRPLLLAASSLVVIAAGGRPAWADAPSEFGPTRALHDAGEYVTAPLRWDRADWVYLGGAIVAIGAAHQFDRRVRSHFTAGSSTALDGKDTHALQDALPAAALVLATGAYATMIQDHSGFEETWSMLEAGGLASATGYVFKFAAGRERPNQTVDPNQWRRHGSSFPSLHVSAAFAIGTVFAESGNDRYRWVRRVLGYGIATATGYERLKHNAHWLSDVVAGAALGMASAHFALNREYQQADGPRWSFAPTDGGMMLSYTVPIH
ncbi:MAG: phosphatase PAP2 family protein [Gammaproteobacteria bacterium]|nr:phosphatase PAP2 family protein [Gammaproteobacteria bacterium]